MTSIAAQLPAEISEYLRQFAVRRRWQSVVRSAGLAAVVTLAWGATCCAIDRFFAVTPALRSAALLANVLFVLAILARPVSALLRRMDAPRTAIEVERRQPRFGQRLATLTSRVLGPPAWQGSSQLLAALTREVVEESRLHEPGRMLPWRPALRPWTVAALVAAALLALAQWSWLDLPTLARRYVSPWRDIRAVTSTRLRVTPGDTEVPEGGTLTIRVEAMRLVDVAPVLHVRSPGQPAHEQPMAAMPDGSFQARIAEIDRELRYEISGGDARSEVFEVGILPRPAITVFHVRYDYPPYTRLGVRAVTNTTGQIEAPAGTGVTLSIEATQPLKLAVMTIGGEAVRMSPAQDRPNVHAATFTVRDDQRYTIRMASDREVSGAFRGGMIRAIPDRPPIVRLRSPTVGAAGGVSVDYDAVDDYGLARLDAEMTLTRQSGAMAQRTAPIAIAPGTRSAHGAFQPDLAALDAAAGDRLEVVVRAEDHAGQFDVSAPAAVIVESLPPAGSVQPVEVPRPQPPNPPAPPLDPQGYDAALEAYFDALRRPAD